MIQDRMTDLYPDSMLYVYLKGYTDCKSDHL